MDTCKYFIRVGVPTRGHSWCTYDVFRCYFREGILHWFKAEGFNRATKRWEQTSFSQRSKYVLPCTYVEALRNTASTARCL